MDGYSGNARMCNECGGKPGEHGPGCSYGDRLTREYVAIELEQEARRERAKKEHEELMRKIKEGQR